MPIVTMIAGPNGSGKSTLTNMLVKRGISFGEYLNADNIAKDLVGDPVTTASLAQQMVRDARAEALRPRLDHCFETVMSHPSHIDHLIAARKCGFVTRLFFVATDDPRVNLSRVKLRVAQGGHDVPAGRVVARYHRCLANLPAAIAAADEGAIYDNSDPNNPFFQVSLIANGDANKPTIAQLETLPVWWLTHLTNSIASPRTKS
jgi:predicted ABC-type ATPase